MSTIVTRAGKGAALTHNEMDANFTNLNTDKYQSGSTPSFSGSPTPSSNVNFAVTTTGSFGGGYVMADGSGRVAMWTDGSGTSFKVGIGTTSGVITRFNVDANGANIIASTTNTCYLYLSNSTNGERYRIAAGSDRSIYFSNDGGSSSQLIIDGTTDAATFSGSVTASGGFQMSSRELKTDIKPVKDGALARIMALDVKEFVYKNDPETHQVGVIAEETDERYSDGKKVNTSALLFDLVQAVKELQELYGKRVS